MCDQRREDVEHPRPDQGLGEGECEHGSARGGQRRLDGDRLGGQGAGLRRQATKAGTASFHGAAVAVHSILIEASVGLDWAERRSEEHTSELPSLMRSSYAVFCLKNNT